MHIDKYTNCLILFVLALLFCSCSQLISLKSESGLYDVPLKRSISRKVPVIAYWSNDNPSTIVIDDKSYIYIAPLDIKLIEDENKLMSQTLKKSMHNYMKMDIGKAILDINKKHNRDWNLTDDAKQADIRIDMAIVQLRAQHPVLKILSKLGGGFVNIFGISSVSDYIAAGGITIEGSIRNGQTKELYFAFKDKNGKSTYLYQASAYSRIGQADTNLKYWSETLASLLYIDIENKKGNLSK